MQPLIVTMTFLLLLSALVSGKMKEYLNQNLINRLDSNYKKLQSKVYEERQTSLLQEFKDLESESQEEPPPLPPDPSEKKPKPSKPLKEGPPPSLNVNMNRPPNNSRLNIHTLVQDYKGKVRCYEIAARLLRRLYGHLEFFQKTPSLEYKILDALILKRDEMQNLAYPDDLASLDLKDPTLQEAFSIMLKGHVNCPSLLYFITLDPGHKKINFMFAPEPLLEAAINDPKIFKKALQVRSFYWDLIHDQEDHRKERLKSSSYGRSKLKELIEGEICEAFSNNGSSFNPKDLFDFTLGQMGNILIITDPETCITIREKVLIPSQN